jgi:hypothetical protein
MYIEYIEICFLPIPSHHIHRYMHSIRTLLDKRGVLAYRTIRLPVHGRPAVLYYHAPKDASENFYFDKLPAGTYVIEYPAFVSRTGTYSGGIAHPPMPICPRVCLTHGRGDVSC